MFQNNIKTAYYRHIPQALRLENFSLSKNENINQKENAEKRGLREKQEKRETTKNMYKYKKKKENAFQISKGNKKHKTIMNDKT